MVISEKKGPLRWRPVSATAGRIGVLLCLAAVSLLAAACSGSTPPGPDAIGGSVVGGASFMVFDWQEGLRIMLWNDLAESEHLASSTSSTTDPLFRQDGNVQTAGGGYDYHLETADGVEAAFTIDGVSYDLNLGKVFLIEAAGGETKVQQLDLDISGVEMTQEGIAAFGRKSPDIAAFTASLNQTAASATPTPPADGSGGQEQGPDQGAEIPSTGLPELDELAAVILENNLESRRERLGLTAAGCTTAEGLGGPPKCQPGQEEGSPVEFLPVMGPGEGTALLPEELDQSLDFQVEALYAAYRRADLPINDPFFAPGAYGLIFSAAEAEGNIQYILVHADEEGRIVRLDYLACPVDEAGQIVVPDFMTCSPQQVIEGEAGEVLLAPPEEASAGDAGSETQAPESPLSGLAYKTDEGLWIIDAEGQPSLLIDEPTGIPSADGRYVLYQPEYDKDIWLADLASGERRSLTEASGRFHGSPQWWPGKPELILMGSSSEQGPGYGFPTMVNIDGSGYQLLDEERGGPAAISPDGEKVAYGGFDQPGRILTLAAAAEDFNPAEFGVEVEKVFVPAWSPDGRQLAWKVSGNPDLQGWSLGFAVFDLESKSGQLLHTYTAVGGGMVPDYLAWSPDGERLAFVTYNERAEDGRAPSLWIAQPDGSSETYLGQGVNPVWSPDGARLAYSRYDESQFPNAVWVYDTATGEQSQALPEGTQAVSWSLLQPDAGG